MERFKMIFHISVLQVLLTIVNAVSVPDPVAVYPLNSKYQTKEIKNRVPQGVAVGVSLADGPDGKAGGSYSFAGQAGSYIEFPNNGALDVQSSITMLCWVYPMGNDGPLFNYKKTGPWGVHLWIVGGQLFVRYTRRNYQFTQHLLGGVLPVNEWSYVGSTYDQNSGIAKLWVDGKQTSQHTIGRLHLSTQDSVRMGVKDGDWRYFRGKIAAMQLYNVALSAEQINAVEKVGLADACEELKPCKNGATCSTSSDGYKCSCVEGFQGTNCEHDIDDCKTSNPCKNGGRCVNTHGNYECKCKIGFTGRNCETDIDECQTSNPCENGGKCVNTHGGYECKCKAGSTGRNCETAVDECQTLKPCQNGGQCENTVGGYKCACKPGFTGRNCETDIDDCLDAKVPCYNGGTCVDGINNYTCDCKDGYVGKYCEWEKKGCFKEVKKKSKKAMRTVFANFRKFKKNIQGAVEACIKAAGDKNLEIFAVRGRYKCVTTKGQADYKVHGASSKGCKAEGEYAVGVKSANYVYILSKHL